MKKGPPRRALRRCTTAGGQHFPVREVMHMVTYSKLIQIGILIVSICSLVYQICKRK